MKSICVFCGSSAGSEPGLHAAARNLGIVLARRNIQLVYGGASVGLMGILADTVLENQGKVVGVIPSFFSKKEIAHKNLDELIFVESMHERKKILAERSDAFIALPGGFGTLDEFFEVLTWSQLDLHQKAVGILNAGGYYDDMIHFFDLMVNKGFLKPEHRKMVLCAEHPDELIEKMLAYKPVRLEKWLHKIKEEKDVT